MTLLWANPCNVFSCFLGNESRLLPLPSVPWTLGLLFPTNLHSSLSHLLETLCSVSVTFQWGLCWPLYLRGQPTPAPNPNAQTLSLLAIQLSFYSLVLHMFLLIGEFSNLLCILFLLPWKRSLKEGMHIPLFFTDVSQMPRGMSVQ